MQTYAELLSLASPFLADLVNVAKGQQSHKAKNDTSDGQSSYPPDSLATLAGAAWVLADGRNIRLTGDSCAPHMGDSNANTGCTPGLRLHMGDDEGDDWRLVLQLLMPRPPKRTRVEMSWVGAWMD